MALSVTEIAEAILVTRQPDDFMEIFDREEAIEFIEDMEYDVVGFDLD